MSNDRNIHVSCHPLEETPFLNNLAEKIKLVAYSFFAMFPLAILTVIQSEVYREMGAGVNCSNVLPEPAPPPSYLCKIPHSSDCNRIS